MALDTLQGSAPVEPQEQVEVLTGDTSRQDLRHPGVDMCSEDVIARIVRNTQDPGARSVLDVIVEGGGE